MLTPMGWPPDEENGNFQEYNFDRGGRGGDAVQANAQDGSGYNVSISAARDLDESSG
jgi:hypothetical protein